MSGHETDRPELSERARGWLRYMYRKALVNDDWSKEGHPSEMWDGSTMPPLANWHRFDAVDSTYAIALMSDVTPAWREVYSVILDRLVECVTSYWGAKDWTEQIGHDPKRTEYPKWYFPTLIPAELRGKYDSPGWAANGVEPWGYEPDPVKAAGAIYYKGFLSMTMGLHLYASGDKKYDDGFTIVNNGEHTFRYTHTGMNEFIRQQWRQRPEGPHCENTKVWPLRLTVTSLGLRLSDIFYGSDTFGAFVQWYEYAKQHYVARFDDQLPEWSTMYYDPLIDMNHKVPSSGNWVGWAFYLLPNDREMAHRLYEVAKRGYLVEKADGTAHMVAAPGRTEDNPYITIRTLSLAHELGDTEVVKKLRAYVEAHYEPTWDREAGEFYYLFGLREPFPRGQYNANLMVSEVAGPGAWWRLFNEPNLKKFEEPTVYGVDYPQMGLSQAYYDRQQHTLMLRTYPLAQSAIGSPTSFRVKNLARPDACTILADGAPYAGWAVREGELEVTTTIDQRSFQIVKC